MIRQHNRLPTGTEQVLEDSGKNRRLRLVGLAVVLFAFAVGAYSAEESRRVHNRENTVATPEHAQTTNTVCPVMTDMKVDPNIFADHEGKRVYFCCPNCRAAFGRNPTKYLALLPQFGGVAPKAAQDLGKQGPRLTLPELIKPVGIATLSCLGLTVAAALLRRKEPRFLLKWHKRLGIATLVLAVIHLILVLIAH